MAPHTTIKRRLNEPDIKDKAICAGCVQTKAEIDAFIARARPDKSAVSSLEEWMTFILEQLQ